MPLWHDVQAPVHLAIDAFLRVVDPQGSSEQVHLKKNDLVERDQDDWLSPNWHREMEVLRTTTQYDAFLKDQARNS